MRLRRLALAVLPVLAFAACGTEVSPLAAAARRGDLVEIDRLVAAGADPHAASGVNGWPPLLHALHKGQQAAALRLMNESGAPSAELDRALFMASGYAQTEMVKALLSRGADPHYATDGATTLGNAVAGAFDIDFNYRGCEEHTATVRALLAAAPDLTLAGASGASARRSAERRGCADMLALVR